MHLKEIVINGFKSFADRTRLDLQPGVVAIVGPNGCGKSNIADAIRWVLGEQSAKALRGGRMQDVIFEGSENRKPLPICEVSLRFTDCEKQLGTAFHEVEITRRVSREGSSDYYLNGKGCRLKDIQRLFMDTGVGRVSYSFLVQGQIDQILSTNPADRRVIFEEAAGITRYKAQRRETMNKLALVEANLARVTDVIEEISRQIGSLKRQASKALRFQRLKHRLTHLELALLARRAGDLGAEIGELESRAGSTQAEAAAARAAVEQAEGDLAGARAGRTEVNARLQEAQQEVYKLRAEKENAESRASFAKMRRDDLIQRRQALGAEITQLQGQVEELRTRAASDQQTKQLQLNLVGTSDQSFQERNQLLFLAQEKLNRAEAELQNARQRLLLQENAVTRGRSALTTLEVDLKTYQVRHGALKDQEAELGTRLALLQQQTAELRAAQARREDHKKTGETALAEARAGAERARLAYRELQAKIQETDRQMARLNAHRTVLQNLNASFEGFGEGTKAILQGKLDAVLPPAARFPLTGGLQVDASWTAAVEALLGSAKDALVVESLDSVAGVIDLLEARRLGRACFRVPVAKKAGEPVADLFPGTVQTPDWLRPAREVVAVADERLREAAEDLFREAWVCPSLTEFLQFWKENPGFTFQRVATRRGDRVDGSGLIHGGHAAKAEASFLQRQTEIRSLNKELARAEEDLKSLREQAEAGQRALDAAEAAVEERRQVLNEVGQELNTLAAQVRQAAGETQQAQGRLQNVAQQIAALEANHEEQERKAEKGRDFLRQAEEQVEEHRQAIARAETAVQAARDEREAQRESLSDVRLQLAEKKQRLETIDRSLAALEEKLKETAGRRKRLEYEQHGLATQIVEREKEEAAAREEATRLESRLSGLMQTLARDRELFQQAEKRVKELEDSLSRLHAVEREREAQRSRLEVRLAELRSRHGFLVERTAQEYQIQLGTVDWRAELWKAGEEFERRVDLDSLEEGEAVEARPRRERGEPTAEDRAALEATDWAAVDQEVNALKDRIAAMGPVNLVAIEEYSELSQRHQFLKTQSDDLWNSKEKLLAAIEEINRTSQTLFHDTFLQITKNFKFTYDQLTGGGFADLALVDSGDPLDSGIEITARPPGTKLKSISLLSGGQKTMTAVALLFAIYMVKPSPFCVLDELDAPLDDANIGRFTQMLKRFTEFSQFLIITHNKRTIASANLIFGVTMPEKGVSRTVSMRFNHEQGEAEAVPGPHGAGSLAPAAGGGQAKGLPEISSFGRP